MRSFENFKYLDNLIRRGNEIVLDCDVVLADNEDSRYANGIVVDVDGIIIDGAGHTIDARQRTRIFECRAKNVTIRNIKLINGYEYMEGGAILNSGDLTIENSAFADNRAANGGAILNRGDLTITGTAFSRNRAYIGLQDRCLKHMMDMPPCGGAIWTNGNLNITGSAFAKNTAEVSGGAIFVEKVDLKMMKSRFSENVAYDEGGAIFKVGGISSIEKTRFSKNLAYGEGGAIVNFKGELTLADSTFGQNFSWQDGGAIVNWANLKVTDSTFIENRARGLNSFGRGGAIENCFGGNSIIRRSVFTKNAAKHGGAICQNERLSVTDCVLVENTASKNGGAIGVCDIDNFTLNNCTLRDNTPDDMP